jgi:hypothetical protein
MRTFFDTVTTADYPRKTKNALAYYDGHYANIVAVHKRFPKATVVTVTVLGTPGAHMADCETGDLSPTQAAAWAHGEHSKGRTVTIYANESTMPAVKAAIDKTGLRPSLDVLLFLAKYDGDPTIPPGYVGKQYQSPDGTGRGFISAHYDVSSVLDYWRGVDKPPKPPKRTPLTRWQRRPARQLLKRLRHRRHPLAASPNDRALLAELKTEIAKVEK